MYSWTNNTLTKLIEFYLGIYIYDVFSDFDATVLFGAVFLSDIVITSNDSMQFNRRKNMEVQTSAITLRYRF